MESRSVIRLNLMRECEKVVQMVENGQGGRVNTMYRTDQVNQRMGHGQRDGGWRPQYRQECAQDEAR